VPWLLPNAVSGMYSKLTWAIGVAYLSSFLLQLVDNVLVYLEKLQPDDSCMGNITLLHLDMAASSAETYSSPYAGTYLRNSD
jgi:hypothetical protein